MKTLGLYLHIPFCRQKCAYCDFCSFPAAKPEVLEQYTEALCNDLKRQAERCRSYTVDTVFVGGGTPTVLKTEQLERILQTLQKNYHLAQNSEISAECNPATADFSKLDAMRKVGFNRLSMGLQSIHENELKKLGRIHTFSDFLHTFENARRAGFQRINADLMFGIPEQSEESFAKTLETVCDINPEHLSVYSLIPEAGTPLGDRLSDYRIPDEDSVANMYLEGITYLESRGFFQYEISNFAKKGEESRHNLKYWNQDPYLGFGPSAYSDFEGKRFGYGRNLQAYLQGTPEMQDEETPTVEQRMNEYVMLRLRLRKGVSLEEFANRFGKDGEAAFGIRLQKYVAGGFAEKTDSGYAFTPKGFSVSNTILSDILDF